MISKIATARIAIVLTVFITMLACSSVQTHRNLAQIGSSEAEPWKNRYLNRNFPSIFSPWVSAENLNLSPGGLVAPLSRSENSLTSLCRHDLIWSGPGRFGLKFNQAYPGLADGFEQPSFPVGLRARANILHCNSNAIIAVEIRYHDAPGDYLPEDSPWWKRDNKGNRIIAWKEGGYFKLDFSNPDLQKRVAAQCASAVLSGVVDGCFFDWWSKEDEDRLAMIRAVRTAIGDDALIIVNVNGGTPIQSAQYINGIYMEGFGSSFFNGWQLASKNLIWAKSSLRQPAITAFEGWYLDPTQNQNGLGRNDVKFMRMLTTLSLVFSDGTVLFGDPNPLPTPDHLHDWYPFWSTHLGKPIGSPSIKRADGSYWREYEHGTVVFNPPENSSVNLDFSEDRTSQATQARSRHQQVGPGDGDLFIF
jgi:hypothetical protein